VNVELADLGGLVLGRVVGNTVFIDDDAVGHGWFVDPAPGDDSEFDANGFELSGSAAEGHIDLLSALMHEFGHVLGLDHDDGAIMAESLATGVRLPYGDVSSTNEFAALNTKMSPRLFDYLSGSLNYDGSEKAGYRAYLDRPFVSENADGSTRGVRDLFGQGLLDELRYTRWADMFRPRGNSLIIQTRP